MTGSSTRTVSPGLIVAICFGIAAVDLSSAIAE